MNISGYLKKLDYLFPVFALGALLYASVIETQNIAVTHDELWDYYPAVGMLNAESLVPQQEVMIFGFPLPLVTGPYQGALKTWLIVPVLKLFGTSPAVLRGINVLLGLSIYHVFIGLCRPPCRKEWPLRFFYFRSPIRIY